MIPLKLTVKNFLCYRDNTPTLDLESVHLACLCGDNGHGKSALLDAITFALWGSSRLGERGHDDLIHKGQSDMLVELEFESAGGRYRVARRRARGKSQGRSSLEFSIRNDAGEWRAITGNTVKDTQAFIIERIRMDHETFVNTAFLRQGDADRFTTSKPADRKRILAEVLDLSYYDELESRAKEKVSELRSDERRLEAEIEVLEREASQKETHEKERDEVSRQIAELEPQFSEERRRVEAAVRRVAELQGKRAELDKLIARIPEARNALSEASSLAERYGERVKQADALISRQIEIERGHSELTALQDEDERLNRALNAKNENELAIAEYRQAIAVERERLITQREQLENYIETLRMAANALPQLEELLEGMAPRRQKMDEFQKRIDEFSLKEKRIRHELEQMEGYRAEYEEMREYMLELETKLFREKSRLTAELDSLVAALDSDARPRAAGLDGLLKEKNELDESAAELGAVSGQIEERRERMGAIDERLITLRGDNERLRETMNDTRQKFDLLESGELECPLCGQELDSDGREHLRSEYEEIGVRSREQFQSNEGEIAALERERERVERNVSQMESELRAASRKLQNRQGQIVARIEEAESAAKRVTLLESEVAARKETLESESFMPKERSVANKVKELLNSVKFDPSVLDELTDEHRKITDDTRASQRELDEMRAEVDKAENEVRQRMRIAVQARDEIEPSQAKLAPIVTALALDEFSREARAELAKLEAQVEELGYDSARHSEVHERIMDLVGFEKLRQRLDAALGQIEWDRDQLKRSETDARNLRSELSDLGERRESLSEEAARLPEAIADEERIRVCWEDTEKRLTDARVRREVALQAVERCARMEREAAQLGGKRDEMIRERNLYEELSIAFGRNGIQALIIEDALPSDRKRRERSASSANGQSNVAEASVDRRSPSKKLGYVVGRVEHRYIRRDGDASLRDIQRR